MKPSQFCSAVISLSLACSNLIQEPNGLSEKEKSKGWQLLFDELE
jgi:hypothetical protein